MLNPAIGLIEYSSIAKGIVASDVILKKAPVKIIFSASVCPGKYIILFTGDEASVLESLNAGKETISATYIDSLYIPNVHKQVVRAISGVTETFELKSVGIVETFSVASSIEAADISIKAAQVDLIEIRLAMGIGGKSFYTLTGEQDAVEAALSAGVNFIKEKGLLVASEIIPMPHKEMKGVLF